MTTHRPPELPTNERIDGVLLHGTWYKVMPGSYTETDNPERPSTTIVVFTHDDETGHAVMTFEDYIQALRYVPAEGTGDITDLAQRPV